jgi:hypothetical protein
MMSSESQRWLDRSQNVTRIYYALWVIGIVLVVLDVVVHRHDDIGFAEFFGFYAWYGFCACAALVLVAKLLRRVVRRSENYYDA